jgi:hypothetical protein
MDQIYTSQKPSVSTSQGADPILIALIDLLIAAEKASVQTSSDLPLEPNCNPVQAGGTEAKDRASSAKAARLLRAVKRKERLSSQASSASSHSSLPTASLATGGLDLVSAVATAEVSDILTATVTSPAADVDVVSSVDRSNAPILKVFVPNDASTSTLPDTNGIIYWLGTANGTEPWINPMVRQTVLVTMSSMQADSKPAMSVVGRDAVRCVTRNEPRQSISIDLKGNRILPTHYMLRHYSRSGFGVFLCDSHLSVRFCVVLFTWLSIPAYLYFFFFLSHCLSFLFTFAMFCQKFFFLSFFVFLLLCDIHVT